MLKYSVFSQFKKIASFVGQLLRLGFKSENNENKANGQLVSNFGKFRGNIAIPWKQANPAAWLEIPQFMKN